MDFNKTICRIFDHFYDRIYHKHYKLDLELHKQDKKLENFYNLLAAHYPIEGVSYNFLIQYLSYQFYRFANMETKRDISFGWLVGEKNFLVWHNRNRDQDWYVSQWLSEKKIDISLLKHKLHFEESIEGLEKSGLDPAEELEKSRFKNNDEAKFYNCLHHTTLYNHESTACAGCFLKRICKRTLKSSNLKLYKDRGYK